ncbi:PAF acetylhydrolase family protein [Lophium mytilinum]|uniref:1-alkyl-2-acetylglycerophosphocholine esterase n=1 Tax=Lophium mytilinum TaxID=390894 RepID=A0A6A6RCV6_9PEZI|nr:PAF acetylhydrolase family protein [Lophium mytilinum]
MAWITSAPGRWPLNLGVLVAISLLVQADILIPKPAGQYETYLNAMELVDTSRKDPYATDGSDRAIMISMFYPISSQDCLKTSLVDYMPAKTAAFEDNVFSFPNGSFESFRLQTCTEHRNAVQDPRHFPLVLFSPGFGGPRFLGNAISQSIASTGYAVVLIDHPYDANIVEFPGGRVIYGANLAQDSPDPQKVVATRTADMSFVLDQLSDVSVVRQLIPGARCAFNTEKAAAVGHSIGGATAVAALQNESRLVGGVDMDGTFFSVNSTIERPVLVLGREDHNRSTETTWRDAWSLVRSWKEELDIVGFGHFAYCDAPILLELGGLSLPAALKPFVGTIEGHRALEIVTTYVKAFLGFVLRREQEKILEGPSDKFPEVRFY